MLNSLSQEVVESSGSQGENSEAVINGAEDPNDQASHSPPPTETSPLPMSAQAAADHALREQGAVTQGELLRQEQEAGIVPIIQQQRQGLPLHQTVHRPVMSYDAPSDDPAATRSVESADAEEVPHARGPETIGMEDTGPQRPSSSSAGSGAAGLDIDAAVGRGRSKSPRPEEKPASSSSEEETAVKGEGEKSVAPVSKGHSEEKADEVMGEAGEQENSGTEQEEEVVARSPQALEKDADGDTPIADADAEDDVKDSSTAAAAEATAEAKAEAEASTK
jgi:hypothetical protein